jgi:hypothetical protein
MIHEFNRRIDSIQARFAEIVSILEMRVAERETILITQEDKKTKIPKRNIWMQVKSSPYVPGYLYRRARSRV